MAYVEPHALSNRNKATSDTVVENGITIGKVIARNGAQNNVDVVLRNNTIVRNIPIVAPDAGTRHGIRSLPKVANNLVTVPSPNGVIDFPRNTEVDDTWAVIAFIGNKQNDYVCLGFMFPDFTEMSMDIPGLSINRHESNVVELHDASGNWEKQFPDGTFIKVGSNSTATNLSALNFDNDVHPWTIASDGINRIITMQLGSLGNNAQFILSSTGITLNWPGAGSIFVNSSGIVVSASGSGKVFLGGSTATLGVARLNDTVTVNLPASAGGGTTSGSINSSSAVVLSL